MRTCQRLILGSVPTPSRALLTRAIILAPPAIGDTLHTECRRYQRDCSLDPAFSRLFKEHGGSTGDDSHKARR